MKVLNFNEINQVSGGGTTGDAITCATAVGAIFVSEGVAALVVAASGALGACINLAEDLYSTPGGDPYDYDNACHSDLPPSDYDMPIYY